MNDFIKYAKEEFDSDIILEKQTKAQDTFESIFGESFLEQNNIDMEIVNKFNDIPLVSHIFPDELRKILGEKNG